MSATNVSVVSMDYTVQIVILLFIVAIIAGWVDAVAGGGGLLTVPALMLAGLPPAAAIATNKLQGSSGTFTAAFYFWKKGAVSVRDNWAGLLTICIGAMLGGFALTQINVYYLNFLVPVLLILIGLYFLFYSGNLDAEQSPKIPQSRFNFLVSPSLGFYDGFFGPGTGTLATTSFVSLRGMPIRKATANAKLFNFASNFAALVYFIFFGQLFWLVGFAMMGGQVIGAYLGAKAAMSVGAKIIRPITILMCFAMSLAALWNLVSIS